MTTKIEKLSDLFRSKHNLEDQLLVVNNQIDELFDTPRGNNIKIVKKENGKEVEKKLRKQRASTSKHPMPEIVAEFKRLATEGFSNTAICKKLKIASNTWIKKYKPIIIESIEKKGDSIKRESKKNKVIYKYQCMKCDGLFKENQPLDLDQMNCPKEKCGGHLIQR